MKKKSLLLILSLIIVIIIVLLIVFKKDKVGNIDVSDTDFAYKVNICDEYFELVECIIDKDTDERFTKQMRIELKNEVRQMQEKWKDYSEEELTKKCTEELENYINWIKEKNLNDFGCIKKN